MYTISNSIPALTVVVNSDSWVLLLFKKINCSLTDWLMISFRSLSSDSLQKEEPRLRTIWPLTPYGHRTLTLRFLFLTLSSNGSIVWGLPSIWALSSNEESKNQITHNSVKPNIWSATMTIYIRRFRPLLHWFYDRTSFIGFELVRTSLLTLIGFELLYFFISCRKA